MSASWAVPADAVSGIYIARLVSEATTGGGASHIAFVVREDGTRVDGSKSDILFQTSDTTWQAYNYYGGASLYGGNGPGEDAAASGRAFKVSYNRPIATRATSSEDWLFNAEYPMVRFLEKNGFDVTYFTGVDADRYGDEIAGHDVYMSVGHDEYWSKAQRDNVEKARDGLLAGQTAPVSLAFFSSNEIFWKHRWENSIDQTKRRPPHARLLQGDARQREGRPVAGVDGHVARRPLLATLRRRQARERPHRDDLHGELLRDEPGSAGGRRPDAVLAKRPDVAAR